MKQKYLIIGSLGLLLLLAAWMVADLFFLHPEDQNPYEYDLASLRNADTSRAMYQETKTVTPSFTVLHGISTSKSGQVYLCGQDTLEILNVDYSLKKIFTLPGTANCVFVDAGNRVLLGMGDHLLLLDPAGTVIRTFDPPAPSTVITSIAADGEDIFVADAGNKVVYRYDYSGKLLNRIGQKDPEKGIPGFIIPSPYFDLALGEDHTLWVVNPGRHQFEKYDKEGNLLDTWKRSSMDVSGFCGCCNPSHFAILPGGAFVTSEKSIERVKIHDPQGNFVCLVALPSSFIPGSRGLDLAVAGNGDILVLDPEKQQLRVFRRLNK